MDMNDCANQDAPLRTKSSMPFAKVLATASMPRPALDSHATRASSPASAASRTLFSMFMASRPEDSLVIWLNNMVFACSNVMGSPMINVWYFAIVVKSTAKSLVKHARIVEDSCNARSNSTAVSYVELNVCCAPLLLHSIASAAAFTAACA